MMTVQRRRKRVVPIIDRDRKAQRLVWKPMGCHRRHDRLTDRPHETHRSFDTADFCKPAQSELRAFDEIEAPDETFEKAQLGSEPLRVDQGSGTRRAGHGRPLERATVHRAVAFSWNAS